VRLTRFQGTNPIAGVYPSKAAFLAGTVGILRKALTDRWDAEVTNVIAGGEQAAIELTVTSEVNRHLSAHANKTAKEWRPFREQIRLDSKI
jgi:hypothetical protein